MNKGKLIIFEGIDGSGKSSQYKRICEKLDNKSVEYKRIVFPRYENESSALIRLYLNGKFGMHPDDVNAYAASLFFAVDRFASYKDDWGKAYEEGKLIIADRYVTSNIIHQGSKLPDDELIPFFDWLYDLEFEKLRLPKPDCVIYLDVDIETSLRRMKRRNEKNNSSSDIHESDIKYLERCLQVAEKACSYFSWKRIPYIKDGMERELTEKNEEIFSIVCNEIS